MLRAIFLLEDWPKLKDIEGIWLQLAEKKRHDLFSETDALSVTQKKLLINIANDAHQEFTGKAFLSESNLASSTVIKGLETLLKEDFIEKKEGRYYLVDPLLKVVIKHLMYLN